MKGFVSLLLVMMFATQAFAYNPHSLEWQKISLEDKVQRKISNSLSTVLKDNQYLVNVEVSVNDPGAPNFDNGKKAGIKISDIRLEESRGDHIAFSKVGLEVPVLEKWHNEDQERLMNLYKFNEAYDIFKNLEAITINVFLSDKLKDNEFEIAKQVVTATKLQTGGIKPKVNFEKLTLELPPELPKKPASVDEEKKKKQEEPKIFLKDWLEWASRFGNAFGLIMATILLGLISFLMFRAWKKFKEEFKEKNEEEQKKEEEKAEEQTEEEQPVAEEIDPAILEAEMLEKIRETFAKFRAFMQNAPVESSLLIKNWINSKDETSKMALKALAQQLEDYELVKLFQGLSEDQRESWKRSLDRFLEKEELLKANQYISEEVVRSMIVPSRIQDNELINMLLQMTPVKAVQYMDENPAMGKVLMNVLTTQYTAKILDTMDKDKAFRLITDSLTFDFSQVDDGFVSFKDSIKRFLEKNGPKPFNNKILEMLPEFNPAKETLLYEFLAKEGMKDKMMEVAMKNFPSDLMMSLPKDFLKSMLQNYPMTKKVELVMSRDEENKQALINSFAEEGSSARELLDLEIDNMKNDKQFLFRVENKKEDIWKEYVDFARKVISQDKQFQSDRQSLIESWVDELAAQSASSSGKPRLKQAA